MSQPQFPELLLCAEYTQDWRKVCYALGQLCKKRRKRETKACSRALHKMIMENDAVDGQYLKDTNEFENGYSPI